jgi:hypothetical protein
MNERVTKPKDVPSNAATRLLCIHTTAFSDRICGKPVPKNRPNGWLCIWHAQVVLRGEGVLNVSE